MVRPGVLPFWHLLHPRLSSCWLKNLHSFLVSLLRRFLRQTALRNARNLWFWIVFQTSPPACHKPGFSLVKTRQQFRILVVRPRQEVSSFKRNFGPHTQAWSPRDNFFRREVGLFMDYGQITVMGIYSLTTTLFSSLTLRRSFEQYCDPHRQFDPVPSPAAFPNGTVIPAYKGPGVETFIEKFGRGDLLDFSQLVFCDLTILLTDKVSSEWLLDQPEGTQQRSLGPWSVYYTSSYRNLRHNLVFHFIVFQTRDVHIDFWYCLLRSEVPATSRFNQLFRCNNSSIPSIPHLRHARRGWYRAIQQDNIHLGSISKRDQGADRICSIFWLHDQWNCPIRGVVFQPRLRHCKLLSENSDVKQLLMFR